MFSSTAAPDLCIFQEGKPLPSSFTANASKYFSPSVPGAESFSDCYSAVKALLDPGKRPSCISKGKLPFCATLNVMTVLTCHEARLPCRHESAGSCFFGNKMNCRCGARARFLLKRLHLECWSMWVDRRFPKASLFYLKVGFIVINTIVLEIKHPSFTLIHKARVVADGEAAFQSGTLAPTCPNSAAVERRHFSARSVTNAPDSSNSVAVKTA